MIPWISPACTSGCSSRPATNSQRRQRLLHNLSRAMTEELTPRQQEMLHLYYYEKLNMAQIAGRLGVNKSTVSRTLCRARHRLHHILQYSL